MNLLRLVSKRYYRRIRKLSSKLKFDTIRFKISVLYTVILGVVLIVYTSILYISLYANLMNMFDAAQLVKLEKLQSTVNSYAQFIGDDEEAFDFVIKKTINLKAEHPKADKISELHNFWIKKFNILHLDDDYIAFFDEKGKIIANSPNLNAELLAFFPGVFSEELFKYNIKFKDLNVRVMSKQAEYNGRFPYYIQVATSIRPIIETMKIRLYYRLIPIPIILFFGFFIGNIFSSKILVPVENITKTAQRISHKDLKLRVNTKHLDQEMKHLSRAFNSMITRLEQAFVHIERFSSNVAHELKTPLSIMRLELELALWEERSPKEYKKAIQITLESIERMRRIIQDLFLLANLDFKQGVFTFKKINCCSFIKEIYENTKILAAQKEITMKLSLPEEALYVNADTSHLKRLFLNLIHNAIKFNKRKGNIEIIVESDGKNSSVSVKDTGCGIAEKNLPLIFERFFHSDNDDMSEHEHGNGLGLSIVNSIAKIHKGSIKVKSKLEEGSTFTVFLPLA